MLLASLMLITSHPKEASEGVFEYLPVTMNDDFLFVSIVGGQQLEKINFNQAEMRVIHDLLSSFIPSDEFTTRFPWGNHGLYGGLDARLRIVNEDYTIEI